MEERRPEVEATEATTAAAAAPQIGVSHLVARLPPEFVAVVGHASPDAIAAMLETHPQLAGPILAAVHQLHGNGFAQAALTTHHLRKPAAQETHPPTPNHPQDAHNVAAPTDAHTAAPDPQQQAMLARRKIAGWDQLATAAPDERATPSIITLPPNIVEALEKTWQDTLATKTAHEQGGNLVHKYRGGYEIRRRPNEDAGQFDQEDSDVGWLDTLVAQVHTHPYREEKAQVPEQFASFSDGDFDSLLRSDAHLSVLRSGVYTFVLAKTKQFNALVEPMNNEEDKLFAFAMRMKATYDAAAQATPGTLTEQVEAGVLAVCAAFHLVYYEGQGGELQRKTKRPGT
jgi:hypothetical protein